jgi:putative glutamine amidotransferase
LGERNSVHRREGTERREHAVSIVEGSALERIAKSNAGRVNSSHHQAVDRLAERFRVSAVSEDGVVEAFEPAEPDARPFVLGVQWHPEGMAAGEPLADQVLDALLTAKIKVPRGT